MSETLIQPLAGQVVTVIRTGSAEAARTLVDWLAEGGLRLFEITTSVPGHHELMADLVKNDRLMCGMGTVLDAATAHAAIDAGARFLVSPCVVADVVVFGREAGVPVIPGAATPTEVLTAHRAGASAVKLFPAKQLGGPGFLKAVRSILPDVPLMPTGGIELDDIDAYRSAGAFALGMGSQLASEGDIAAGRHEAVVDRARRLAAITPSPNQ